MFFGSYEKVVINVQIISRFWIVYSVSLRKLSVSLKELCQIVLTGYEPGFFSLKLVFFGSYFRNSKKRKKNRKDKKSEKKKKEKREKRKKVGKK